MEIVLLGGRIIAKALYGQLAAENERRSIEREPAGSFSANVGKDRTIQRSRPGTGLEEKWTGRILLDKPFVMGYDKRNSCEKNQ